MSGWLNGTVIEKIQWNERLFSLRIEVGFPAYKPGQFVRVALDIDGERVARPYSLVSIPEEDGLEIFFNIVPEGPLSPRLAALTVGEAIFVASSANGFLVIDEVPDCRDLWLLATGTGVGPFLAILKSALVWQRFEKVVLAYSVRNRQELAYRDKLDALSSQHPGQFVFVPFITRESVDGAIHRRIPAALEDGSFEARVGVALSADRSHVMMCGSAGMLNSVAAVLQQRGMKKHLRRAPGHFSLEKYH